MRNTYIYTETKKLIKKYGTRDPFEIMDQMNIVVGETSRYKTLKGYCFLGKDTSLTVNSKSISKGGGTAIYRGVVYIGPKAAGTKGSISCESLMLDNESRSDTIPDIIIENDDIDLGHEAKIGRIPDEDIYYLMSRGLSEEDAKAMLVRGFAEPISKELPLEYAVEMNRLIDLEFEGAIG